MRNSEPFGLRGCGYCVLLAGHVELFGFGYGYDYE
jgi:hypothetical protein